jgi:hypothetical protein
LILLLQKYPRFCSSPASYVLDSIILLSKLNFDPTPLISLIYVIVEINISIVAEAARHYHHHLVDMLRGGLRTTVVATSR